MCSERLNFEMMYNSLLHIMSHTYDQNMTMSADCQEDACYSEKGEHLLVCFWTCILPSVYAGIKAFGKVIMLHDVEPFCFFSGNIFIVVCISWHSSVYALWVSLTRNGHNKELDTAAEVSPSQLCL